MTAERRPFIEHLQELRTRVMYCLAVVVLGSIVGYAYYDPILTFLLRPLKEPLYYSSPAGGFDLMFKISTFAGVLLAVPVFVYHTFQFIAPTLPVQASRSLFAYVLSSCVLLLASVSFAYFVCLPAALSFLREFNSAQLHSLISASDYFRFVLRYTLGLVLVFQLPPVMLLVNAGHRLPAAKLMGAGRYVILGSFILAAILSPAPDVVNQTIVAVPMIGLYYAAVALIGWKNRASRRMLTA